VKLITKKLQTKKTDKKHYFRTMAQISTFETSKIGRNPRYNTFNLLRILISLMSRWQLKYDPIHSY